jgi:RNase P subunit RPR2
MFDPCPHCGRDGVRAVVYCDQDGHEYVILECLYCEWQDSDSVEYIDEDKEREDENGE